MKQKLLFLVTLFIFSNAFSQLNLGDDISSCQGETITLDATISASDTVLYEWYLNGVLIPNNLEPIITVTQTGNYTALLYIGPNDQDTDSVYVTFNPSDDSSFFLTPTADGAIATITGESGGTFSFNPIPADGVLIDVITGTVSGAVTDSSYCVEYTTNGVCPSSTISCFIVNPTVTANQPSDLLVCDDDQDGFAPFNLTLVNNEVLGSQNASDFMISYYFSQTDAIAGNNPISNANNFINTNANSQTIYVRVTEISANNYNITSFSLIVNALPQAYTPFVNSVCQNEPVFLNDFYTFEILGNQNPNDFSVSYYYSLSDANAQINAINANEPFYDFFQNLYAVVNSNTTNCVSNPLEFFIDVIFIDYIYPTPLHAVDYDNDGFALFDLDSKISEITGGQNNLSISFYQTYYDAQYDINVLNSPYTNTIANSQDVYFRVEDFNTGCLAFDSLTLITESEVIEVNAFIDANNNSVFDASETKFSNGEFTYEVNNDGVINSVNSSSGSFLIINPEAGNTYDFSYTLFDEFNSCLNQTITVIDDVEPIQGEVVQVNFPITQVTDCNDIAVYLLSNSSPRPGLEYTNTLIIENLGSLPVSGSVEFTHDDSVTLDNVYNLDSGNTVTNTATGFVLNFNDLQSLNQESVSIVLNIPTNLNIGDIVTNMVVYNVNDINIDNNESSLTQEVVNSYDPNNKLESHGPEIKLDEFTNEDYLYYTINFQNLGTAEAIDIKVEDVLDAQLDATTFKMLNASHDFMVTRVSSNLTWQFDAINLPSESMDEPNSHGYVYFKIKPFAGYQEGDIIPNTADIYFDFNPAITTNTFETKFVTSLSVGEFSTIGYNMYPNPTNGIVHIQFNKAVAENVLVSIYNVQGKLISKPTTISNHSKISFNVSSLSQGMYFVELKGGSFKAVEKLIVE